MFLSLKIMAMLPWKEMSSVENLQIVYCVNSRNTIYTWLLLSTKRFFVIITVTWDIFFVMIMSIIKNDKQKIIKNNKQNADFAPTPGKTSAHAHEWSWMTPMYDHEWSCFLACVFRAFTRTELLVGFRSLNFGCKINTINPLHNQPDCCHYFIEIICNNKCDTQITMSVAHYSKWKSKSIGLPIWRALI